MKEKERQTKGLDVKKEFQQVRKEIKETEKRLDAKIDQVEKRLDAKIDKLDAKIDQVEIRLDDKIDIAVESMKAYTDVKFSQVQSSFQLLGDKLDTSVKGIVNLIERGMGNQAKIEDSVQNHEQRISYLETKIG